MGNILDNSPKKGVKSLRGKGHTWPTGPNNRSTLSIVRGRAFKNAYSIGVIHKLSMLVPWLEKLRVYVDERTKK